MKLTVPFLFCVFLCFSWLIPPTSAADPTYWQDVRPALRRHCTVCHSTRNLREIDVSGGLTLDSYEAVTKNAKKPLLKPGNSDESLLIQLVTTSDTEKRMPLGAKPLPEDIVSLLRRWIDAGAKEGTKPDSEPVSSSSSIRKPHRKLDLVLNTNAMPPMGYFGSTPPAALQLILHEGPLPPTAAVAFSPDGKLLATGAYGFAAVWDLQTGRPVKVLTNVLAAVNDLKFSPDGKVLAVAGGQPSAKGDLRLFQVDDWKLLATLGGHEDVVACVSFSPDGKRLASASFDRTVRVWDLASRKQERVLTGHSDFVYSVAFSPDGQFLASASKDRSVKLVEALTGKSRLTFSGMNEEVLAVAYSPDGQFIVSSGIESGLFWWNPKTGERATKMGGGHRKPTTEICFSRDGKILATSSMDGTVNIANGATGETQQTASIGSYAYAVALSGEGKRLAVGAADGMVRLYEVKGPRLLATLVTIVPRGSAPEWLIVTPEGYTAGSENLVRTSLWQMGKTAVQADRAWKALSKPDLIAQALAGKAPPPVFTK